MVKPLTKKQDSFAREVVLNGGDKVAAFKAAGYAWKTYTLNALCVQADKQFNKPNIILIINELQAAKERLAEKTFAIDAGYVLRRLKEIDELDVLDIIEDDLSAFRPLSEWPKAWRISVSSIDIKRIVTNFKDDGDMVTMIDKIKWPNKTKNLELIGRHISVKAWDHDEQAESNNLVDALTKIADKLPT